MGSRLLVHYCITTMVSPQPWRGGLFSINRQIPKTLKVLTMIEIFFLVSIGIEPSNFCIRQEDF